MYRYIFFDLDGTLSDSKEGIVNCARYAIEKMGGTPPEDAVLRRFVGPPLQDSFAEFCGYTPEQAWQAIQFFRERYGPVGQFENYPAPGAAELLARLRERGCTMALASSKEEGMCRSVCEHFGYAPYLSAIAGSPPEGDSAKAAVLQNAMNRLGVREADKPLCLMVGDRKYDVQGARECGIGCLGVELFGCAVPGELEEAGALAVARSMEDVEAFILGGGKIPRPSGRSG